MNYLYFILSSIICGLQSKDKSVTKSCYNTCNSGKSLKKKRCILVQSCTSFPFCHIIIKNTNVYSLKQNVSEQISTRCGCLDGVIYHMC